MPKLHVTEFAGIGLDAAGLPVQCASVPPLADQVLTFSSGSSVAVSLKSSTSMVRLIADATCCVAFGASPVATSSNMRLAPNHPELFMVRHHPMGVAVIDPVVLWKPDLLGSSSLALWMTSQDASTVITSGAEVLEWRDKSGNARHFESTAGRRPSYVDGAIVYNEQTGVAGQWLKREVDGAGDLGFGTGDFAYFALVNQASRPRTFGGLLSQHDQMVANDFIWSLSSGGSLDLLAPGGATVVSGLGYPLNQRVVAAVTRAGTVVTTWKTGLQTSSATDSTNFINTLPTTIGSSIGDGTHFGDAFDGEINEIIVVGGALSEANRRRIEGYLAWTWGIQSQLPTSHPYAGAPPAV